MQPATRRQSVVAHRATASSVSCASEAPPPAVVRHSITTFLQKETSSNNIKVVARFRPKNELELSLENGKPEIVKFVSETSMVVGEGKDKETITFDRIFSPSNSQSEVFESVGAPVIEDVLTGYNGTVFAYGQTGSGKTYSMMGVDLFDDALKGMIPRAASKIFSFIEYSDGGVEFTLSCSMLEIYKETLNDLLTEEPRHLKIKEDTRRGIYVQGLTEVSVDSEENMLELIAIGEQMRTVGTTRCNAVSSRSHTLFMLEIKQKYPNDSEKRGILNLVDLAGSEKVHLSGVTGNGLDEAKKINLSLSALGNVIHALINGSDHVPYRDSKLTRLLQESLGGNYKTTILIALSPCFRHYDETMNTIKFAQRAKNIRNKVTMNIKSSPEQYQKVIDKLAKDLQKANREILVLRGNCPRPETVEKGVNTDTMSGLGGKRRMSTADMPPTSSHFSTMSSKVLKQLSEQPSQVMDAPLAQASALYQTSGSLQSQLSGAFSSQASTNLAEQLADQFQQSCPFAVGQLGEVPQGLALQDMSPSSSLNSRKQRAESDSSDSASDSYSIHRSTKGECVCGKGVADEKYDRMKKKYRAKIKDLEAVKSMIDDNRDNLKSQVQELEASLQSCRKNLLAEKEDKLKYYKMYHQSMTLINKDDHASDTLKKQIESLEQQVKLLTGSLEELDDRFRRFIESAEGGQPVTVIEFADLANESTFMESAPGALDQSRSPEVVRELPLDSEVLAKAQLYSETMLGCLEQNSALSGQMEVYQLRNQVIQAGLINANLMRIAHSLKWKNSLLVHKYHMKKMLAEHQKNRITQLEAMLDSIYTAHNSVCSLMDKLGTDTSRQNLDSSIPSAGLSKSRINKPFSKGLSQHKLTRKGTERPRIDMSRLKGSFADRSSFVEGESAESGGGRSFRYRTLESNLQMQTSYNIGLKATLAETEQELKKTQEFVDAMQGEICSSHEQERLRWTRFLELFKSNCERELLRKQDEVVQLNQLLSSWIQRYLTLQEDTGIPSSTGHKRKLSQQYEGELRQLCTLTTTTLASLSNPTERLKAMMRQSPFYSEKTSSTKAVTAVTLGSGDESPPLCESD